MLINNHKKPNINQSLSQNIFDEMGKAINNCLTPVIVSPTAFEYIKQKEKDMMVDKSGNLIINGFIIKPSPAIPNDRILLLSDDLELRKSLEEMYS